MPRYSLTKYKSVRGGFYLQKYVGGQPVGKPKPKKEKFIEAARLLRKAGYNITYKANDSRTFNQRAIISRLYNEKKSFLNFAVFNPRRKTRTISDIGYNFIFKKLTPKQMRDAKAVGLYSREQFTKGGVFIEKAVNVPAYEYNVNITSDKVTQRMRRETEVNIKLDPIRLVKNPIDYIKAELKSRKKANSYRLLVNGFRAENSMKSENSIEVFSRYIADELLPDWMERNEQYYDEEEDARNKFADIFHLQLNYINEE